jgi:short subunit dehydrogenase-like uncharacterized protein
MTTDAHAREHDVVVFGATGFVGKLTAAYLAEHAPAGTRIALAGRSRDKLARVQGELGPAVADWPLIVADSHDAEALGRLAASTKVVATTVGPYLKYGMPLVKACAEAGTHYADLTGETLFMRRSIDEADAPARASGARIVHTCGFDSIPSDIGVLLLHEHAQATGAGELEDTTLVVKGTKGGVSGGTIDSMRGQLDEARADRAALKLVIDPYALSPDRSAEPKLGSERDPVGVIRDPELGGFLAPFVMGTVNTRVVRRSNALLGHAYGRKLRYRELMLGGELPLGPVKAAAIAGGVGALVAGLSIPPTRKLLDRVLPDPGEGPDEKARDSGLLPHRHPRAHEQRQAPRLPHQREGGPRLQGHRGHARRGRARARPRRGPPPAGPPASSPRRRGSAPSSRSACARRGTSTTSRSSSSAPRVAGSGPSGGSAVRAGHTSRMAGRSVQSAPGGFGERLVRALAAARSDEAATRAVLGELTEALGGRLAVLWLLDPSTGLLRLHADHALADRLDELRELNRRLTFAPGVGLPGRVLSTLQPAWVADVAADPDFPRADVALRVGARSVVAAPLLAQDGLMGVLEVFMAEVRAVRRGGDGRRRPGGAAARLLSRAPAGGGPPTGE